MDRPATPRRSPVLLATLFLIAAAAISIGAYRFHQTEKEVIEAEVRNQLLAVADLKVRQLSVWRGERIGDAYALASNRMMMPALERIVAGKAGETERKDAQQWLQTICERLRYANALLADRDGKIVLSVGVPMGRGSHFAEIAHQTIQSDRPVLRDFHRESPGAPPHLGMNLPLRKTADAPAFGVLLLGIDPKDRLYRLIESWPAPSQSAETLLVRREGDEVVFLNNVRFQPDAVLKLRLPLTRTSLPAVQAVQGKEGVIAGRDYRGVPVLAVTRQVPDSPWAMVAKVDEEEVHAPVRRRSITLGIIVALLILTAGGLLLHVWRRQQLNFYRERYQAELERRALLGHYDYLTRFANDIILLGDADGHIIEANDRAVAAYGYPREQLIGMLGRNLRHPSTADRFDGDWQCAAQHGGGIIETVHQRADGSSFPAEVSMRIVEVEGKRFYQSIIRDITERNAMVEKLRETVATLNTIVDASPAAIVALNRDRIITLWSRAAERMFGYRADKMVGHQASEDNITPPDERAAIWERLLAGEPLGPLEMKLTRKNGTSVDVSLSAVPLFDSQGNVTGCLSVMLDVTELRSSEKEQRLLGATVAASLNEVYLFDAVTLRFRFVNKGALENLGYTLAEMQTMTPLDIKPEYDAGRFEQLTKPLLEHTAKIQIFETVHRRADGSVYPVEAHMQLFEQDGERVFLAVIQDITERRRAEEALRRSEEQLLQAQKMEGIGRLAGGVAHDFNNHLTVINGYCDMVLAKLGASDPMRDQILHVRQAGEQAAHLTHQLLAFSRRQVLEPRVLNLNDSIADTQRMLRRLIGEDIELITMLDPNLGAITADPGQMSQVLMNLLVNARDAMPDGGKIIIETSNVDLDEAYTARHPEVKPGAYVMLAVSDTGSGMDAETQQRIFEPFFTTKKSGEGTGLGLATVYGIVRQSGGWIWVYSEPGRGTNFKLYFARTGTAERVHTPPEAAPPAIVRGNETILVVEDQEEVRRLTASVLGGAGYRILEAGNGEQALSYFAGGGEHIHLLFTDVVMPGMTGRELASRVAALSPTTRVLYTSGYTANVIAHRGVLDEGVDYLPKPFTPSRLLIRVREILDRQPVPDPPTAL